MAGTAIGGVNAAKTNKQRYGTDFYKRIGSLGGKKGKTRGFYANRELARTAGAKGGRISRRVAK
jgi:general stress protein YciG